MGDNETKEFYSNSTTVKCGGAEETCNHPNVFLEMSTDSDAPPTVRCPYCGNRFVLNDE